MLNELILALRRLEDPLVQIVTHDFPDADALSSAFALSYLLRTRGIFARIRYGGLIDRSGTEKMVSLHKIPAEPSPENGRFSGKDVLIFVDCQGNAGNTTASGGTFFACIDHHPTYGEKPAYVYEEIAHTGACATLLTEAFTALGEDIPKDVATCLLYGLKMDTLNFTREVSDRDIVAFRTLNAAADQKRLNYLEMSKLVISDLKAFGSAIEHMEVISDIGLTLVPFDCPDGLVAALADFMLGLDEIELAVVFSVREGGIKLSVRSILPYIDAGRFTHDALLGIGSGGGHTMFAGGFIPRSAYEGRTEKELMEWLKTAFVREYGKQLMESTEAG